MPFVCCAQHNENFSIEKRFTCSVRRRKITFESIQLLFRCEMSSKLKQATVECTANRSKLTRIIASIVRWADFTVAIAANPNDSSQIFIICRSAGTRHKSMIKKWVQKHVAFVAAFVMCANRFALPASVSCSSSPFFDHFQFAISFVRCSCFLFCLFAIDSKLVRDYGDYHS